MTKRNLMDELTPTQKLQRAILIQLNQTGKHIYGGTVPAKVVAQRRAANKRAKASRRANRGR